MLPYRGKGWVRDSASLALGDAVLWDVHSFLLDPLEVKKG